MMHGESFRNFTSFCLNGIERRRRGRLTAYGAICSIKDEEIDILSFFFNANHCIMKLSSSSILLALSVAVWGQNVSISTDASFIPTVTAYMLS